MIAARTLRIGLVGALAATVLTGVPAEATTGNACDGAPAHGFADVPAGSTHDGSIACILWYQVTAGVDATHYQPAGNVLRFPRSSGHP